MPQQTSAGNKPPRWALIVAVVSGLAFLAAILTFAFAIPDPTTAQFFVFRTVLALAAAAFGAAVPGLLRVDITLSRKVTIQATGALAIFVVVYFLNPPEIVAPTPTGDQVRELLAASSVGKDWIETARKARESGAISELTSL
jgi:hypothetical protein